MLPIYQSKCNSLIEFCKFVIYRKKNYNRNDIINTHRWSQKCGRATRSNIGFLRFTKKEKIYELSRALLYSFFFEKEHKSTIKL